MDNRGSYMRLLPILLCAGEVCISEVFFVLEQQTALAILVRKDVIGRLHRQRIACPLGGDGRRTAPNQQPV